MSESEDLSTEKNNNKQKSIEKISIGDVFAKLLIYVLKFAVIAFIGATGGYYAAMSIPVPNQIMVFDLDAAMKDAANITINSNRDPKEIGTEIVQNARARIKQFTDTGVVVIDKAYVIDAPDSLYISTKNLSSPITNEKKPMSVEDIKKQIQNLESQMQSMKK